MLLARIAELANGMSQAASDERSVEVFAVQGYIADRPPVAVVGVTNVVRVKLDLPPFERRCGKGAGLLAEALHRLGRVPSLACLLRSSARCTVFHRSILGLCHRQ